MTTACNFLINLFIFLSVAYFSPFSFLPHRYSIIAGGSVLIVALRGYFLARTGLDVSRKLHDRLLQACSCRTLLLLFCVTTLINLLSKK